MALWYIFHYESALGKQIFRGTRDFLSMLQRTGRVIGDDDVAERLAQAQFEALEILGDILRQRRDLRGGRSEIAVFAQHVAVVLDHGSTAGCRHQDRVETAPLRLRGPDRDVRLRRCESVIVATKVVSERAATLLVADEHDLDAVTRQQIDGGLVDSRRQHLLRAALEQRDAASTRP